MTSKPNTTGIPSVKRCTKCRMFKPLLSFYGDKRNKDGCQSRCKPCTAADKKDRYYKNRESEADRRRAKYSRHKERYDEDNRRRYYENKEKYLATYKEWRGRNKARVLANVKSRKVRKSRAEPPWLTDEHRAQIRALYKQRHAKTAETGVSHDVDHVHALKGPNFCGLHVPWNLQVLTSEENAKKGNKPPPDEIGMFFSAL